MTQVFTSSRKQKHECDCEHTDMTLAPVQSSASMNIDTHRSNRETKKERNKQRTREREEEKGSRATAAQHYITKPIIHRAITQTDIVHFKKKRTHTHTCACAQNPISQCHLFWWCGSAVGGSQSADRDTKTTMFLPQLPVLLLANKDGGRVWAAQTDGTDPQTVRKTEKAKGLLRVWVSTCLSVGGPLLYCI